MRPSLWRLAYGGGPRGGPLSDEVKLRLVKRLLRMLVRLVLGPQKVAEFDQQVRRLETLSQAEMEAEVAQARLRLRDKLDRESR